MRLQGAFEAARARGGAALMPFLMAGDPDLETSLDLLLAASDGGADILEIGLPFTDPIADGPTVQASGQRAFAAGATPQRVLALCRRLSQKVAQPLVLLTYLNPVLSLPSLDLLAECGIEALVVPDLSFEEGAQLHAALSEVGVGLVTFVAPTTPTERMKALGGRPAPFVYAVSVTGVTGSRTGVDGRAMDMLGRAKGIFTAPVAVGFGISSPEVARQYAELADGVIVGSALIHAHEHLEGADKSRAVFDFVSSLRRAL